MSHYLATYIDLIQSIGFVCILVIVFFVLRKFHLDDRNDKYIDVVNVRVDD